MEEKWKVHFRKDGNADNLLTYAVWKVHLVGETKTVYWAHLTAMYQEQIRWQTLFIKLKMLQNLDLEYCTLYMIDQLVGNRMWNRMIFKIGYRRILQKKSCRCVKFGVMFIINYWYIKFSWIAYMSHLNSRIMTFLKVILCNYFRRS